MASKNLTRLARVEEKMSSAHGEVYSAYLRLLPDDDLLALLDNMEIRSGAHVAHGVPGWLATAPPWAVRHDLWRTAAAQVGGYSDQQLLDSSAELIEIKAANARLKMEVQS